MTPRYQEAREQAGLSVAQAANLVRLASVVMQKVEHNRVTLNKREHAALAALYRVTPCWLAGHSPLLDLSELAEQAQDKRVSLDDFAIIAQLAASQSTCAACQKPYQMIAAVDDALGIGKNGGIPWHIPADMAFFRYITRAAAPGKQNAVIMGRKTWESIPPKARPLQGRFNVVVSRQSTATLGLPASVMLATSIEEAFRASAPCDKVFVIGGQSLYAEAFATAASACEALYLTRVPGDHDCDRFFPHEFQRFLQRESVLIDATNSQFSFRVERWVQR